MLTEDFMAHVYGINEPFRFEIVECESVSDGRARLACVLPCVLVVVGSVFVRLFFLHNETHPTKTSTYLIITHAIINGWNRGIVNSGLANSNPNYCVREARILPPSTKCT